VTRYLSIHEVLALHERIAAQSGGGVGLRDLALLESALAQPRQSFGGSDLYSSLVEKAGALGFSLIANHPFVDGNKRIGHAAMEIFLVLNGQEIDADVDEQERVVLAVAAGDMSREQLTDWLREHLRPA
jgi:death-on-curing protein